MPTPTHNPARARRSGFTLTELLVVIAIIALMLSIALVAGNAALQTARKGSTERFLASIGQGLEQFNKDHGYYPPLLNENPNNDWPDSRFVVADDSSVNAPDHWRPLRAGPRLPGEDWPPEDEDADARCFNVYSLALYLQGVGDLNGDERISYDDPQTSEVEHSEDDGADGPGFRSPGPDRSWGGARNRIPHDDGGDHNPTREGRVFGPYVASGDARGLEILPLDDEQITIDADKDYAGMARFIDRWGNPIRYYRDWTLRADTGSGSRRSMRFVPVELRDPTEARDFILGAYGSTIDEGFERIIPEIAGAPYVLLSVGEDGESGHQNLSELQQIYGSGGAGEDAADFLEEIADNVRHIP